MLLFSTTQLVYYNLTLQVTTVISLHSCTQKHTEFYEECLFWRYRNMTPVKITNTVTTACPWYALVNDMVGSSPAVSAGFGNDLPLSPTTECRIVGSNSLHKRRARNGVRW